MTYLESNRVKVLHITQITLIKMCRTPFFLSSFPSKLKTQNSTTMASNENPNPKPNPFDTNNGFAFTTNILLTLTLFLFFLIILLISLHFYARCYLRRARLRHRRRQYLVFHVDSFPSDSPPPTGLDPSVINSLPTFLHSSQAHPIECAVCLSDFEENESGRVLPKCNHTFHVDCIDMWFHSHSTCPLCRSLVELELPLPELVIDVCEPGSGGEEENRTGRTVCSSSSSVGVGVAIDVPVSRSFGRDKEGSTTTSFRSPVGRLASFKRMLSRERKSIPSSPSSENCAVGCSSVNEIETGQ